MAHLPVGVSRPIKICDADRKKQIGLTASTIDDVKEKLKKYWTIPSTATRSVNYESVNVHNIQHLTIVEESDGTILEDDEYFNTLPSYKLLMALMKGQEWTPRQDIKLFNTQEIDQTDSTGKSDVVAIVRSIKNNPANIPLLKKDELMLLSDAPPEELAVQTKMNLSEIIDLQDYCCRRLKDDDELKDGVALLKLYKQALK